MIEKYDYQPGDTLDGKWFILSALEPGAVSRCYLCQDKFSHQKILVKIYHRSITEVYFSNPNFLMQAGVGTAIRHYNIPEMREVEKVGDYFRVIRDYVEGVNFEVWLQNPKNVIQKRKIIECLWQVCQSLAKIHETGKHLNIHPGNILMGDPITYLSDPDPRALTNCELPRFLPMNPAFLAYRAPEILEDGGASDVATDLYSMAALAFRAVFNTQPPVHYHEITRIAESARAEVRDFFNQGLHPNPFSRFRNIEDFTDALWSLSGCLSEPSSAKTELPLTNDHETSADPSWNPSRRLVDPDTSGSGFPYPDASFAPESFGNQSNMNGPDNPEQSQPQEHSIPDPTPDSASLESQEQAGLVPELPSSFSGGKALYQKGGPPAYTTLSGSESFTQFGFKGLTSQATSAKKSEEGKRHVRKKALFAVLSLLAVVFVLLLAAIIYMFVAGEAGRIRTGSEKELPEEASPTILRRNTETVEMEDNNSNGKASAVDRTLNKQEHTSREKALDDDWLENTIPQNAADESQAEDIHWPSSVNTCLKMANELNDMGKIKEANRYYQHALTYPGMAERQRIRALGGTAVTFHYMGKNQDALSALQKILELDPNNNFALSYGEKILTSQQ